MTLEEKAEQYVIKNVCENCNHCQSKGYIGCDTYRFAKKTYIDSVKENGIQWHDLRKNPNDLPDTDREVIIQYEDEDSEVDVYIRDDEYVGWKSLRWDIEYYQRKGEPIPDFDIIMWCEKPQYKE